MHLPMFGWEEHGSKETTLHLTTLGLTFLKPLLGVLPFCWLSTSLSLFKVTYFWCFSCPYLGDAKIWYPRALWEAEGANQRKSSNQGNYKGVHWRFGIARRGKVQALGLNPSYLYWSSSWIGWSLSDEATFEVGGDLMVWMDVAFTDSLLVLGLEQPHIPAFWGKSWQSCPLLRGKFFFL